MTKMPTPGTVLWVSPFATLIGIGLFMGMFSLQDQFLYYPERAALDAVVSERLRPWPSAGDFRGLVADPAGPARGTALVFHGNAGHAGHRTFYADTLNRLGLRVVLAEYPGYGPRAGALGERSLVEDAEKTIAAAEKAFGPPIILVGESLGAGVAVAAGKGRNVAGLLLITPWDKLAHVASHHFPGLPVRFLLRDSYDNVAHLVAFDRPVAMILAEMDSIVPPRFGQALYASLAAPKRLLLVRGADHNDWAYRIEPKAWPGIVDFLLGDDERPPTP